MTPGFIIQVLEKMIDQNMSDIKSLLKNWILIDLFMFTLNLKMIYEGKLLDF